MTISPSFLSGNPTDTVDLVDAVQETASEGDGAIEQTLSVPEEGQLAIIRSMSESCLSLLSQTAQQALPKSPTLPAEKYLYKFGSLHKPISLPTLTSHSSETAKFQSPQHQQASLSSPSQPSQGQEATGENTFHLIHSQPPQQGLMKQATLKFEVPKQGNGQQRMQSLPTTLTVKTYSKGSPHTSQKSASQQETASAKEFSPLLTPMALFSHTKPEGHNSSLERKDKEGQQEKKEDRQREERDQEEENKREQTSVQQVRSVGRKEIHQESPPLPPDLVHFALSESQLGTLFHMRVSHIDILRICAEIMKLMLHSREQDAWERRQTRMLFMAEAEKVEASYLRQANTTKWLGILTASLGIFGALSPVVGEICGGHILDLLQKQMGFWKDASAKTFFKGIGKVCSSLAQFSEAASKVHELQESAFRTIAENYKEVFRIEHDELQRSVEELKEHWRNMDSLLMQILQSEHDTVRNLYN